MTAPRTAVGTHTQDTDRQHTPHDTHTPRPTRWQCPVTDAAANNPTPTHPPTHPPISTPCPCIGGAVRAASLLLRLVDRIHDGDPRRRPFLWPSLLEADVYHVLDRVVDVRHERYQGEACAAAHVVTAAQASAKPHMHMHMHMHVHIRSTHNAGGSC